MKTLLLFEPFLIKNPLKIYKYTKVILNDLLFDKCTCERSMFFLYLKKIFYEYNIQYLKSFKYFIQICENIDFQFQNMYNYTILHLISIILKHYSTILFDYQYNKNTKKILIYLIKKYKSLEIYSKYDSNILYHFNRPVYNNNKLIIKIYKYLLSLNIYYTKYNTYYEIPIYNIILNKKYLLIIKIKNQQEIWRKRRLFILLCIL